MKAMATELGADLLDALPEQMRYPRSCEKPPPNFPTPDVTFAPPADQVCLKWLKEDGLAFRLLYKRTQTRLLVSLGGAPMHYARLAQRGSTMFVLSPMISTGSERRETRCVCDGWPEPVFQMISGFVVDDVDVSSVVYVAVPMTVDSIVWECEEA
jgi:hypothetical protein